MKKITFILGLAAISLVACKKEVSTIQADTVVDSTMATTASPDASMEPQTMDPNLPPPPPPAPAEANPEAAAMEAAKKNPVTTLVLSQSNFDFKDVKKGQVVDHKYEFTNTGKNPLIISEVKPGCGCTVPDYTKTPILPGKKGFVNLKFDSSSFDGAVNKYADVYANVENMPIKLTFSANVVK
ncbi:DUF1573 domain-containing protein [Frigoriflavimonas asaccharolytica]|uniref:DUF1573 domain-containing protein n=1 Tax=Frigoriflavimonas asaccharolytica TaxID=2735899 RepID=A0A8J8K934_9FLAO|nr:DUF1573 domain-containing protein [Frigoriflavimonas asaccharolytica]NRS93468.1 hypothetical protein [Frigoriflavimonas asaccharolytica]